jgi:hypothetical protein
VKTVGGNANFRAKAKLPPIRKLGGGVVHHNGAVHVTLKKGHGISIVRNNPIGVMGTVAGDVLHGVL